MTNLREKIANLLEVKSITTFVVIIVFAILALRGLIEPDSVMYVVTTVIAFYFGTQHEKKKGSGAV